jgi:hypothetical protein
MVPEAREVRLGPTTKDEGPMEKANRKPADHPWDDMWGVALRYANGLKRAYPVGTRDEAERELLDPKPPISQMPPYKIVVPEDDPVTAGD